jgi:adenylate kinase family enzyme
MTNYQVLSKPPNVIILYGPPAAGKGTQAAFLKKLFPDRYHLDFGTELRSFVAKHLGSYQANTDEKVNQKSDASLIEIARRIKSQMESKNPVATSDLRFVIEQGILDCVERGQDLILEGPGRLVEEAQWLSAFMKEKSLEVAIYHLYISLNSAINRSLHRYYIESSKESFPSYEAAKIAAQPGEKPYQRPEDEDAAGVEKRYKGLYAEHSAQILSIYQLTTRALVFTLDGDKPVTEVSNDIVNYLNLYCGAGLKPLYPTSDESQQSN